MAEIIPLRGKYCGQLGGRRGKQKRTTQNVIRAKARKKLNRALRDQADARRAAFLGITVWELQVQRAKEAAEFKRAAVYAPSWAASSRW